MVMELRCYSRCVGLVSSAGAVSQCVFCSPDVAAVLASGFPVRQAHRASLSPRPVDARVVAASRAPHAAPSSQMCHALRHSSHQERSHHVHRASGTETANMYHY